MAFVATNPSAAEEIPFGNMDPTITVVSSGPPAGDGHFRLIVTVHEIYHQVYVHWVSADIEGSLVGIAGGYEISSESLVGELSTIKHLAQIRWVDYRTVQFRVNGIRSCTLELGVEKYAAKCE
jgi:phosphatidylethanolamine-binding protein (PEBP) family uncharacterized protein